MKPSTYVFKFLTRTLNNINLLENFLPEITLDPLYQVTRGIGFPPPDSQIRRNSWPSLKGPIIELAETSRPSVVETLKVLGSATTQKIICLYSLLTRFSQFLK